METKKFENEIFQLMRFILEKHTTSMKADFLPMLDERTVDFRKLPNGEYTSNFYGYFEITLTPIGDSEKWRMTVTMFKKNGTTSTELVSHGETLKEPASPASSNTNM